MDPPPLPSAAPHSYADSLDSSPRSRTTDAWDEPIGLPPRLRLMCSYGGHIVPRPHDKSLCYVGGETRIVVADRNSSLSDLSAKLSKKLLAGRPFTLKYQLPSEDLDSLISVTTDEDLDNMIDEYDRTAANAARPSRIRLFLFAAKPESSQSIGPILESSANSEDWFLNALNGAAAGLLNRGFSDSASVNCLLGLDDDVALGGGGNSNSNSSNLDAGSREVIEPKSSVKNGNSFQDVQSVPDSPMMETTSSFGSTSSSPSLTNLPPIRVHVEEGGGAIRGVQDHNKVGLIEEQFAQMSVGGFTNESGGFMVMSSPPPMPPPPNLVSSASASMAAPAISRVISDDERSDHSAVVMGYRKVTQKPSSGGLDLPSPDSVSSDNSFGNAMPRAKQGVVYHQEPIVQRVSQPVIVDPKQLNNISDPNTGYVLQQQFEPKQQQQQQQQSQTQQQFVHHNPHYIHHHHPPGTVPLSPAYFPVYTSHHQIDPQFPVYYHPARQPQQPFQQQQQQQSNINETQIGINPQAHNPNPNSNSNPNPNMIHLPTSTASGYTQVRAAQLGGKPEMGVAAAGMYRTATAVAPAIVQGASGQQYLSYSHIHHHPSQSLAAAANYGYEFADPAHAQIYFTQPLAPTGMSSQYQTMTGTTAAMVGIMPEGSGSDNMKQQQQQQMRTSQPL